MIEVEAMSEDIYTHGKPPSREGLEKHQMWLWLAGAKPPHYEVRGTGAIIDESWKEVRGE